MYYVQYLQQAAAAVVLPSTQLRCGLWVIAAPYTYSQRFYKQTEQQHHGCQQLSRFLWDLHPHTHTPAPSRITILHLLAAASDGPPEWFHGQEYQVDRDRRYVDVLSCRRAYEQKECGDYGNRGLRLIISRKLLVVGYFDSCNQNVEGDANSCPFTANTFLPEHDSAKKQTKPIWVICIFPVNRAISIGKLEGNYCNWTMRDSSKLKLCRKTKKKLWCFMA